MGQETRDTDTWPLAWVEKTQTILATDDQTVVAVDNNPGWRLVAVGQDMGGRTTLTYGWPWEDERVPDKGKE